MSKFKVGDRVRTGGNFLFDPANGTVVSVVEDKYVTVRVDGEGSYGWTYYESELTQLHPTLTIQAGKFYKTRDGRKVGPMREQDGYHTDGEWYYASDGECCYLGVSGSVKVPKHDLIAEWLDDPVAVAPATATFKVGDRVRLNCEAYVGSLATTGTGTVVGTAGGCRGDWRVDIDGYGGTLTYFTRELSLIASPTPTTIKVGDWVRTDDGDIGIVLHDDGTEVLQFKVGFVGDDNDEHWDWFSDLHLTIVPPGTTKAAPEIEAANDNYEVGDIVEIVKNDGFFWSRVTAGDLASVTGVAAGGELTLRVKKDGAEEDQWINPTTRAGYIRPYRRAV